MIQDIVITIIVFYFGIILIPQILLMRKNRYHMNLLTTSTISLGLFIMGLMFYTMEMYISFIAEMFSGSMWFILFLQSAQIKTGKRIFEEEC